MDGKLAYVFFKLPNASVKALKMMTVFDATLLEMDAKHGRCYTRPTGRAVGGYELHERVRPGGLSS